MEAMFSSEHSERWRKISLAVRFSVRDIIFVGISGNLRKGCNGISSILVTRNPNQAFGNHSHIPTLSELVKLAICKFYLVFNFLISRFQIQKRRQLIHQIFHIFVYIAAVFRTIVRRSGNWVYQFIIFIFDSVNEITTRCDSLKQGFSFVELLWTNFNVGTRLASLVLPLKDCDKISWVRFFSFTWR